MEKRLPDHKRLRAKQRISRIQARSFENGLPSTSTGKPMRLSVHDARNLLLGSAGAKDAEEAA
jgi:hypothetical protein